MADDGRLHVVIDGDSSELQKALRDITKSFDSTQDGAERLGGTIDGLKGKVAAFFSVAAAKSFIQKVYETRSYFQDIESSMKVFLGDAEKAADFTKKLKDYAYYNMFEFSDLAQASQQLIAYGNRVEDVIGIIDKLSNIATATKVPLMEMVGLYNRAKNLGSIDSQGLASWAAKGLVLTDVLRDMGDQVDGASISFDQLNKALDKVTVEGGMFHGLMEEMMPNLSSSWGQLQDELSSMFNEIGEAMQQPMHDAIDLASSLVGNYKEIAETVAGLVVSYGAYRAALVTLNALKASSIMITKGWTVAEIAQFKAMGLVEKAQKALNATLLKNPYILAAAGVAAVAFGLYKLITAEKGAERAQRLHAEAMEEMSGRYEEAANAAKNYIGIVQDAEAQSGQRALAYSKLKELVPELTNLYSQEELAVISLTKAYGELQKVQDTQKEAELKKAWEDSVESVRKYKEAMDVAAKAGNQYMYLRAKEGYDQADAASKLAFDAYVKKSRENAIGYVPDQNAKGLDDSLAKRDKAYWEAVKKEAQAALDAMSDEELKSKKAVELKKKIAEASKKIGEYSVPTGKGSGSSGDSKAFDTALSSARKSAADAEVSAIEDEGARTLAALRLKHRNEIEELERQKAELERLAAKLGISLDFDFDALMANTEARQARETRTAFGKYALPGIKRIDTRKDVLAGVNPAASAGQADVSPDKGSIKEWQELYQTLGEIKDEFEGIGDSVGGAVGDMIKGAGQMVSSVLSMMDSIVTLQNASVEGMKGTAEGAAASISAVEKASVILAVISAAIQIIQKIVGLVKKLQEANDWLYEFNAEAEKLNYELARVKLNARLETDKDSIFGENAWGNAVKNVDVAREALERYNESLDRLQHRDWTVFGMKIGKIDYSSVEQAIGDMQVQMRHATWFRSAKYKSLKDAVPELFGDDGKVDKDALSEFIGSDMFGKLSEENQKYLKELANSWDDYEKATESVRSYLEGLFGDMGSGLSDALTDAFRNGTDAAEEFGKTADEILENMIQQIAYNAVFSEMFDKAQEDMEAIMGDQGLTDEERIRLLTERVRKVQEDALAKQNDYNAILGVGRDSGLFGNDSEREGLSKGIANASQDSVDELNGRATAIQGYTYNIQENTAALVRHSASMLEHLSGIRDNTARLESIERIARDIRDHGVKAL